MKTFIIHSPKYGDHEVSYDDEDEELVKLYKWQLSKVKNNIYYAKINLYENKKTSIIYLHRLILEITDSKIHIDHIDHNGLNNQKSNIRICTHSQNHRNRRPNTQSISKYKGVYFQNRKSPWRAKIRVNNKSVHLGVFYTEEDAALAYNNAAIKYFGEFAYLNIIEKGGRHWLY